MRREKEKTRMRDNLFKRLLTVCKEDTEISLEISYNGKIRLSTGIVLEEVKEYEDVIVIWSGTIEFSISKCVRVEYDDVLDEYLIEDEHNGISVKLSIL